MAEYSNLSATINAQIRANGVQAITGPVLNAVLTAMVNVLGDGYRLAGVAHPADNPGSPDNRVAYLAAEDGTYTNFGGLAVSGEVALLLWDSAWTKEVLFSIDTAVTPGSGHLVTSGAVDDALTTLAGNIAAAYMQLVPAATEGNLAEFDNAGQVRDAGLATSDLATKDGAFPHLFAGFAGNLVDTRSAGTPQGPYAFRQSGGDGVDYMVRIKGKTEAFNQLVGSLLHNSVNYTYNKVDGVTTFTRVDDTLGSLVQFRRVNCVSGHKYYCCLLIKGDGIIALTVGGTTFVYEGVSYSNYTLVSRIVTAPQDGFIVFTFSQATTDSGVFSVRDTHNVFDLTLEGLGFTTADQFRALHPLPYYNYNAGVLKNNAATGIKSRGFNQWDEQYEVDAQNRVRSKNYIKVLGGSTYYLKMPNTGAAIDCYDANYNSVSTIYGVLNNTFTVPSGAAYIKFVCGAGYGTTYNHDICINLSDASRNGTYEPYWERTLALGLNSIPCHDENNNAVVVNGLDGVGTSQDELIVENGWGTKIIKRRGRRAYQAGDESDATLMTDGTNTDYPLPTPKVLTLDNPIPALIEVDNLGTEKRLPEDTAADPQGPFECDSNYSVSTANLVRLLNL